MTAARALLGRPFSILSTPARGRGIGSEQTVPTINLAPYTELLPANGVYVTRMTIGDGPDAVTFDAVSNAGVRPTFGEAPHEGEVAIFHPPEVAKRNWDEGCQTGRLIVRARADAEHADTSSLGNARMLAIPPTWEREDRAGRRDERATFHH